MKSIVFLSRIRLLESALLASSCIAAQAPEPDHAVQLVIPEFRVTQQPLFQCLWLLSRDVSNAHTKAPIILLESLSPFYEFVNVDDTPSLSIRLGMVPNSYYGLISLATQQARLEDILDFLVDAEGKFAWVYDAENNVVNVTDSRVQHDPLWYLNQPVGESTLGVGEGVSALRRIAHAHGIPYSGGGEPGDRFWSGQRVTQAPIPLPASDFRSTMNCILSRVAPEDQRFFMVACLPEPKNGFDEAYARDATVMLFNPFSRGFAEMFVPDPRKR